MMIFTARQADGCKDPIRPFAKFCACQTLRAVNQGQLDVFSRGGARQQIKILEHETELVIPDIGEPISVQTRDVCAVQNISACRRPIATNSPRLISIDTPRTAGTSISPVR